MYKLNKTLIFSIVIHVLLFAVLSQQFSKKTLPVKAKKDKVKAIQATLYFPPIKKQENEIIKEINTDKAKPKTAEETTQKIAAANSVTIKPTKKPIKPKEEIKIPTVFPKPQITKKILTSKISTKSISQSALEKLQNRLSNQALENSLNDSFNQYVIDKNTIGRSTTKLFEVPVAQAKRVDIDCNGSALNTTITVLSGFMGGSIRCSSMPNLKEFLKKRAEEKGK